MGAFKSAADVAGSQGRIRVPLEREIVAGEVLRGLLRQRDLASGDRDHDRALRERRVAVERVTADVGGGRERNPLAGARFYFKPGRARAYEQRDEVDGEANAVITLAINRSMR